MTPSEMGTPQGGSISVLLSNVYLHYALDLWFKRVAKPRLRGRSRLLKRQLSVTLGNRGANDSSRRLGFPYRTFSHAPSHQSLSSARQGGAHMHDFGDETCLQGE